MQEANSQPNLDVAMKAASEGKIHQWVLDFLRTGGGNASLANKLEANAIHHFGPIDYPLKNLTNIIGPNKTFKYVEDQEKLDFRVSQLILAINNGWRPPPLIVSNLWEDELEIADGGHRQRALLKLGVNIYPTVFYFKDSRSRDAFMASL